jgi:methionyl aminopeptidase
MQANGIELKTKEEIIKIRKSAQIVKKVLEKLKTIARAGIATLEFDLVAMEELKKYGAKPAFLGYQGFPKSVCISINNEVVHGIPSDKRILKDGDIVSIDFGVEYDGYFGDAALTVPVGKISNTAKKLIDVTEKALYEGIKNAKVGNKLYDISASIQEYVEKNGFSVVRDYVGHGIGKKLHEEPMVPNFGERGTGPVLKEGMVFAIEPMVNEKGFEVKVLDNGWTVVTVDNGLSAHFEHTIAITKNGPEILSV